MTQPVGEGVSELRIHYGPGYRIYYARDGREIFLLLCGGNKNTQKKDVKQAKKLWADHKKEEVTMTSRNVRATHNMHLRNPEVVTEYLNEATESGDKSVVLMAIRNVAEAQPDGIAGLAARTGLGRESMYKMLSGSGNPKLDSFMRLIRGLRLHITIEAEDRADNHGLVT